MRIAASSASLLLVITVQLKLGKGQIWMINGKEIGICQQWALGTWNPSGWNPCFALVVLWCEISKLAVCKPSHFPPRGEKAGTGSGSGVSAGGTLGVLLWCPSICRLGPSTPEAALQAVLFGGTLRSRLKTRGQSNRIIETGVWELRHPSCSSVSLRDRLCELQLASEMPWDSFPGGCGGVWGGLPAILPSAQGSSPGLAPPSSGLWVFSVDGDPSQMSPYLPCLLWGSRPAWQKPVCSLPLEIVPL